MEFTHPSFLLLGIGLLLLLAGQRKSLADLHPIQKIVCFVLRAIILSLLIFALSGVRWLLPSRNLGALFLVDDSASISPEAQKEARQFVTDSLAHKGSNDSIGVVGFARDAEIWQPPAEDIQLDKAWPQSADRSASDLGRALEFASATFPADRKKRVVLLTDGNDTESKATATVQKLAQSHIEVFTVPLRNPSTPEVLVERVNLPQRLKTGEPFDLTAILRSNVATKAHVKVYQNQFLIKEDAIELPAGTKEFRLPNLQTEGSFVTYEVEVLPDQDTLIENNRAQATVTLRGAPRVLIVESDETKARPLAESLRRENIQADLRSALGSPRTLEDLQQFDLLILSDVSALVLSRDQMDLYRQWVQEFGGGFVMLGGENSYGVGGYFRTPIEQMLPVRMEHEDRQDTPSVALLIVLDRSGSMSAQVQGLTKMTLADQGAVFAMNVLQPKDYFGVTAVDTRVHVVASVAQHGAKGPVEQKIMSVTAGGGGIYIYTALADAFQQLRDVPARIKHVILFSDAADAEEKNAGETGDGTPGSGSSLDLASAMLAGKITTSVVALGMDSDKDTAWLRQLAERGNGRFYLTSDATTLPQIFSTETMKVAQSSLVEEPFLPVVMSQSPLLAGIDWKQAPLLLGYNSTKPKPTAEILLATERGEPLLATWRFGLGQAAAFTSDAKSRWAGEWLPWGGYGKFWAQLVRGMMRKSDQANFQVLTQESGDRLQLSIDAVKPDGSFRNQLPITVTALAPDQTKTSTEAIQIAPGQYAASLGLSRQGTTLVSISSPDLPDGGSTFGHTRSYPREFLSNDANETLLHQLADLSGGRFNPSPTEVFTRPDQATPQRRDLTRWFLMAALILFPLDIWLRRRTWRT